MNPNLVDKMIEVSLPDDAAFLKIKESLTRIGEKHPEKNTLYLPINILHTQGRYFIIHYKVGFMLNGSQRELLPIDYSRTYTVAKLLEQWKLLTIINCPDEFKGFDLTGLIVVPYKDRNNWEMVPKFILGK